ncbi:Ran guanine nucleotide release factor [Vanrija pseudolonga]|uniref:Ran guanine nucleotide release factor n=1 Tax=Vanrija pseudolonga TaxID=143232 RepID=A0AAF1BQZ9_9TREE|nr:Ran guanine nucleotide release factor [Vanrija pseudolonga]
MTAQQIAPRPLFGGAIAFAVPTSYHDASDMRQVPDTQEVFLSHESDTSVIVEILQSPTEGDAGRDLYAAAKFHFDSIAHDNAALSSSILTPAPATATPPQVLTAASAEQLPTPTPVIITGLQTIHKFSHDPTGAPRPGHEGDTPDRVWIGVALWRCWADVGGSKKRADVVGSVNVNLSAEGGEAEQKRVEAWWRENVAGLRVLDWGLIGDE